MDASEHLDIEALSELKDIMEDEFGVLVDTYIEDSDNRIVSIAAAIDGQDAEMLRKEAHSFKGSCGNICATKLADHCKKLEDMGRATELDGASDVYEKVKEEYECVKSILGAM